MAIDSSHYNSVRSQYVCSTACPFRCSSGCLFPSTRRDVEPVPAPDDGVCQFPNAHINGVEAYKLNLGKKSSPQRLRLAN